MTEGSSYAGLEIHEVDGREHYHYLEVLKKKGELHLVKTEPFSDPKELCKSLKRNTPLFLSLNTSKVLVKMAPSSKNENPQALVHGAFPNLDLDNFYYGVAQISSHPIVAISKKEYVNGLIGELKELGLEIFHFSLGLGSMAHSAAFMENQVIVISNFQMALEKGVIREVSPIEHPVSHDYLINGLKLSNSSLLAFSQILGHLRGNTNISNFTETNGQFQSNFKNRRIFDYGLKASLSFFIILLLVNFLIFDHYRAEVNRLNSELTLDSSQKENLISLEGRVNTKKERVETLKTVSNSKSTLYLDRLAKSIPQQILLDRISYQPLDKPVRDSKPVRLKQNTILISGISEDDTEFSKWLEQLEKWDWILGVETLDYDFVHSNASNFTIKVTMYETGQKE
ncbi:PilN domain-containing protein [Ulvibacterium sp.]|uniref:PilN domain-containing protein n=1 Tax=Ulvibacterium sp. TaxID=2665914 RepID=UPI00261C7F1D|nr:PilN domain-containing protein [Ulvibacterium sp.]